MPPSAGRVHLRGHAGLRGLTYSVPDAGLGPLIRSASAWPIHTATRHSTTDSRTLPLASSQRPKRASSNGCKLKAENVVNPPHSPTMTTARSSQEPVQPIPRDAAQRAADRNPDIGPPPHAPAPFALRFAAPALQL